MLIEVDYEYHPVQRATSTHISELLARHEDSYRHLLDAALSYVSLFEKIPIDGETTGRAPFYRRLLDAALSYVPVFEKSATNPKTTDSTPYWRNGWIPGLDAVSLYTVVATYNPRFYVEVGSGNSTKFVRQAITDNRLRTRIVSIDPNPRAEIDCISDTVIRKPLEDVELDVFRQLQDGDVVFLDNSHRSFQNSDVTVFFTEILPLLAGGVVYGLHDIFLPDDYPAHWAARFYNEQYLLHAYLIGGRGGDDILFPAAYVSMHGNNKLKKLIDDIFDRPSLLGVEKHGGCFWLAKSAQPR